MQSLTHNGYLRSVWLVRILPALATTLLLAAFLLQNFSQTGHPGAVTTCMGGALGMMIAFCIFTFSIQSVELKQNPQPADVQPYTLR